MTEIDKSSEQISVRRKPRYGAPRACHFLTGEGIVEVSGIQLSTVLTDRTAGQQALTRSWPMQCQDHKPRGPAEGLLQGVRESSSASLVRLLDRA